MQVRGDIDGPLLRAPASADSKELSAREVRSAEITAFLRSVLGGIADASRLARISSHSLKRTPLSWAAKGGLSEEVKNILGRHIASTSGTAAVYSVDISTPAVRSFANLLHKISDGSFQPDRINADYFPSKASATDDTARPAPVKDEAGVDSDGQRGEATAVTISDEDTSSSSSEDSSSSGSDAAADPPAKRTGTDLPWSLQESLIHRKSHIAHKAHFQRRCKEINLSQSTVGKLEALGVKTLGTTAHLIGIPGQELAEDSLKEWLELNLPGLSLGDVAAFKRLLFESQTLQLSALRQSILDPDNTAKQKLPEAEKSQRLTLFKTANPGLHLDSTVEPGHSLLDLTCEQHRENVFKHIRIEK
ncbi:METTL21B, partial [Symbiodinium sp. CCMP2456]